MMENLFDCLCSLLLHTPNRDRFLRGEGLQLMNLMLREKKVKIETNVIMLKTLKRKFNNVATLKFSN